MVSEIDQGKAVAVDGSLEAVLEYIRLLDRLAAKYPRAIPHSVAACSTHAVESAEGDP